MDPLRGGNALAGSMPARESILSASIDASWQRGQRVLFINAYSNAR